jgi:anti-sigma regulatory factor (Ser/Thr protein kinase)
MKAAADAFCHEALFYAGEADFVAQTLPFVHDGLERGEAVLVLVPAPRLDALRDALGPTPGVEFSDMAGVGRNPARIIPVWERFVDEHAARGSRVRGIGEPVWAGRRPAELAECHTHEALINHAFAGARRCWIRCPYDTQALPADVVAEARRTHPALVGGGARHASADYVGSELPAWPLSEPGGTVTELHFDGGNLAAVRGLVLRFATAQRVGRTRASEFVVAANEIATNSVLHADGHGRVRLWRDGASLTCEIRDAGRITDPLVGRRRPAASQIGGWGVWIANHLCDLVELRSGDDGTVVRLSIDLSEC